LVGHLDQALEAEGAVLAAIVLAVLVWAGVLSSPWWWVAVGGLALFGGFGIYEARAGWCVVRAMGFKTRV
jgi:hypothetical protein